MDLVSPPRCTDSLASPPLTLLKDDWIAGRHGKPGPPPQLTEIDLRSLLDAVLDEMVSDDEEEEADEAELMRQALALSLSNDKASPRTNDGIERTLEDANIHCSAGVDDGTDGKNDGDGDGAIVLSAGTSFIDLIDNTLLRIVLAWWLPRTSHSAIARYRIGNSNTRARASIALSSLPPPSPPRARFYPL